MRTSSPPVLPSVARSRADLDVALADARSGGRSVALVPTMGALHAGHLELLGHARTCAEVLVASVFVNPTQFAPGEDLATYPRSFDDDLDRCAAAGVDVVFAPDVATMYPEGLHGDRVTVDPGPRGNMLEGEARPTHFRGVLTVVAKLFGIVRPDVAVFGEKDFQQLVLVRAMVEALCLPIAIHGRPIVRESDGLAMSSRNRYLDPAQRRSATALSAAMQAGAGAAEHGAAAVLGAAHAAIDDAEDVGLDYLVVTDPDLGAPGPDGAARLLIAAKVGPTRLLDNVGLALRRPCG